MTRSGRPAAAAAAAAADGIMGRSMRVLILTHHYPPEVGAPQTRLSGTARFLRERGHDVRIVTAMPSYPDGIIQPRYRGRPRLHERIGGIPVERTWTYARPGISIGQRLANQVSFTASALAALPAVGRRDVILVESPPLFLGLTGAIFSAALSAPMVLHVSDLWPAVPIELGALRDPRAIWAARYFERAVYAASRRLIVVTERWVDEIVRSGVPRGKIDLVTNGVDTRFLDPSTTTAERTAVRAELGVGDGDILAACIGTVSLVYGYETILDAFARLQEQPGSREGPRLRLLIAGGGSQRETVVQEVGRRDLTDVLILPAQPHRRIRSLLAAADISVSALQPLPVTRGQLPVRILEAMAMARPVAFSGEGVAARLVEDSGGGRAAPANDAAALAGVLARFIDDPEFRARAGAAGRRTVVARYDRAAVAARLEARLQRAVRGQA
ncbi:MAG: glycosyltransferase family 4 protein [Chloroflexi bacterium]|nr:glycosyltransferase family 4 protein [Chloroflexota bacterium]